MPTYSITNLTNYVLPVHSYVGSIAARATFTKDFDVYEAEGLVSRLVAMTNAGLISWTAALPANVDTAAGKTEISPVSLKGGLWYHGNGTPNGNIVAPQGAVYTNTVASSASAAVGSGNLTTVAAALLNPNPSPAVETFTVNDGFSSYLFQFVDATHALVTAGATGVTVTGLTADQVRDAIITAVNLKDMRVTASSGGAATVLFTKDDVGINSTFTVTDTVAAVAFAFVLVGLGRNCTLWAKTSGNLISILSSTDASPIVITTAVAHGLSTGVQVRVASHLVNTNANGTYQVTYVSPTTFKLNGSTATGGGAGGATGTVTSLENTAFGWIGK